jgi:hypothetical protein
MPKAISVPVEKVFKLEKFDPTGETTVTIRQATQSSQEQMAEMFSEVTRRMKDETGVMEVTTKVSSAEVMRRAAWLTMVECNVMNAENTAPLFKFNRAPNGRMYIGMSEAEFSLQAWGELPVELADEIYDKVLELNPQWGNEGKK